MYTTTKILFKTIIFKVQPLDFGWSFSHKKKSSPIAWRTTFDSTKRSGRFSNTWQRRKKKMKNLDTLEINTTKHTQDEIVAKSPCNLGCSMDPHLTNSLYIYIYMYMYIYKIQEVKWPLFWLERALFWRVDLQKERSLGLLVRISYHFSNELKEATTRWVNSWPFYPPTWS